MKTKARVLVALWWVLVSAIGRTVAVCVVRPQGQGFSAHYLFHQLWPVWAVSGAPTAFLMAYLLAPWYMEYMRAVRGRRQSSDKRGQDAA